MIKALSPNETTVLIYENKSYHKNIYSQIKINKTNEYDNYNDYEENTRINISNQYVEVDILKKNITLEESQTHLKFETVKEFSQAKVICLGI